MGMQPTPSTSTWGTNTTVGTMMPSQPSTFGSILGGLMSGIGLFGGLRKGGEVKHAGLKLVKGGGLGAARKRHDDAGQDRAQVLKILREKNLIKNRGGLAAARRAA
jgi:hypothetical protein